MESFEEKLLLAIGRIERQMSFVNKRVAKLEHRQNWLEGLWTALAGAYVYLLRLLCAK